MVTKADNHGMTGGDKALGPASLAGTEDTARELHQRVLRGDSSLIETNSVGGEGPLNLARRKEREEKERSERSLVQIQQAIGEHLAAIDNAIAGLEDMAAWHREQAEEARQQMEKIGQRMAGRGEFIADATDIICDWEKNKKLDREKAIEALRRRGIEASDRMSDVQLLELLRREQRRALEENADDSTEYEKWKQEREKHLEQERELERKAEEYRRERERIMNDPDLDPEERERQLRELAKGTEDAVKHAAEKHEQDKAVQKNRDSSAEVTRDASQASNRKTGFRSLSENFGDQADPQQAQAEQTDELQRQATRTVPSAPGVNA